MGELCHDCSISLTFLVTQLVIEMCNMQLYCRVRLTRTAEQMQQVQQAQRISSS